MVAVVLFGMRAAALPWTPSRIAGIAIAAPALVLLVVARLQLGGAFSVQAKASNLVTTGLYSRIRNPIYVFGCLLITGVIIWFQKPMILLVFVILIPMQVWRSRQEAKVLAQKFGAEYEAYRKQTWF